MAPVATRERVSEWLSAMTELAVAVLVLGILAVLVLVSGLED